MRRNNPRTAPPASLGAKLQGYNLANRLNEHSYLQHKGMNSFETTFTPFGTPAVRRDPEGYAEGGIIQGPGTGTSDSIPAKLPVDSAIIPKDKVDALGIDFLNKLEAAAPKAQDAQPQVDANVSNGEFHLSKEAVAYWGKDFVNKLIDNESAEATPDNEQAEAGLGVKGYKEGAIIEPYEPSLSERALNTADSNAAFRQRNPDFGKQFAQDNANPTLQQRALSPGNAAEFNQRNPSFGAKFAQANAPVSPAPAQPQASLAERVASGNVPSNPGATDLRGRLGLESMPAAPGLRDRALTGNVAGNPQAPDLRGRLGMPPNPVAESAPVPSLRDRVFSGNGDTVRPGFGKNLPDTSMPKVNPWEAEMQSSAGQGLGARVGSGLNKLAGAAGALGSVAGIAAVAAEPSEGDKYLAARGDQQANQALATGGFNPIANKLKAPINAGMEAVGNAFDKHIGYPAALGLDKLLSSNGKQAPAQTNQPQAVAKSDTITPPASTAGTGKETPPPLGVRNLQGYKNGAPYYNDQPVEHTRDTNIYGPGGVNLGANPSAEALNGTGKSSTNAPSLGAYAQSNDNGGAFPVMNADETQAYNKNEADAQRLRALGEAGQIRDPYTKAYLGQQNNLMQDNYAAENQLGYATLAQREQQANMANALGRDELAQKAELAKSGANQTKYQAVRNPEDNTVRMVPESGPGAEQSYQQQTQDDIRTQNALSWLNDPNASPEHVSAAKAWLNSKRIALPRT